MPVNNIKLNLKTRKVSAAMKAAAEDALTELAEDIVETAKALAPVDTGTLRESIVALGVKFEDGVAEIEIIVDPRQDRAPDGYAAFVELGTAFQAPQPFLGPAFEIHKDRFRGLMREKFRNHYR